MAIPSVRFGWIDIAPNATSSITVRNGLTGHQFEITETDEIESIVKQVNTISPLIGLRGGAPGYIYLLVFHASDGSEVDRITLVSENTVVMDDFTSSTNISGMLDYLSILETGTSKNPAFNALYQAMNGMELREMDKIIYPVCTLCRDLERSGFIEGVKVGVLLQSEL